MYRIARNAGLNDIGSRAAVLRAYGESNFNPHAVGDGGTSLGAMQVGRGAWNRFDKATRNSALAQFQ